jgi:archaellum component FlaF (FlaF/FlaG flagellin family)
MGFGGLGAVVIVFSIMLIAMAGLAVITLNHIRETATYQAQQNANQRTSMKTAINIEHIHNTTSSPEYLYIYIRNIGTTSINVSRSAIILNNNYTYVGQTGAKETSVVIMNDTNTDNPLLLDYNEIARFKRVGPLPTGLIRATIVTEHNTQATATYTK